MNAAPEKPVFLSVDHISWTVPDLETALAFYRDVIGAEGEIALGLGSSRIDAKGRVADTLDVDARFSPLQLNDLLPTGEGMLRGTLKLTAKNRQNKDLVIDINLAGFTSVYDGEAAMTFEEFNNQSTGPSALEQQLQDRAEELRKQLDGGTTPAAPADGTTPAPQ